MTDDTLNLPMFFGFVGMFIMLMFGPGLGRTILIFDGVLIIFLSFVESLAEIYIFSCDALDRSRRIRTADKRTISIPGSEWSHWNGRKPITLVFYRISGNLWIDLDLRLLSDVTAPGHISPIFNQSWLHSGRLRKCACCEKFSDFFVVITWSNIWTAFFPGLGAELGRLFRHCLF